MTTPFTWSTLEVAVAAALVQGVSPWTSLPADFTELFPVATSYAEGRICRDIVLLNNREQNYSLSTTVAARTLSLASITPILVAVEGVALITPSGTSSPLAGTREPFDAASLDVIDQIWPQESATLAPNLADFIGRYWAMRDDANIVIAPTPDAIYTVEITGLFIPAPISATNTSTYISTVYPDLLFAAVMKHMTGALLRNFGAQADDPRQSQSWEGVYQELLGAARHEELRRRGLAPDDPAPTGKP